MSASTWVPDEVAAALIEAEELADLVLRFGEAQAIQADALEACLKYDGWKREIERLTEEIATCFCPEQEVHFDEVTEVEYATGASHFASSKKRLEAERDRRHDASTETVDLEDIEAEVADCPACSRLCRLIRERKHARQRWGVAKRAVRHVARKAREDG